MVKEEQGMYKKSAYDYQASDGITRRGSELSEALAGLAASVPEKSAEKLAAVCGGANFKKVFADRELMRTAECFISSNLNISAAARELYMHRNTMMYRLDKIKKLTGLDIRCFDAAVTFKILYAVYARRHEGMK